MNRAKKRQRSIKQIIILLLILSIALFGAYSFLVAKSREGMLKVHFEHSDGSKTGSYFLEIADTAEKRSQGLMYRKSMPADQGMFFKFDSEKIQSFWMKNTYIPLDMIFLDKDLKVVGLLENVPALNEIPRKIDKPSKFIVELNAGESSKVKIDIGSRLLE